jgi:DinB superfamily
MKTSLFFITITFLFGFQTIDPTLSKQERFEAIKYLKSTKTDFLKAIKGLSEAQLNFKPDSATWSVAECAEHIALSEKRIFEWGQSSLKTPAEPAKRAEIKLDEKNLIAKVTDRSGKVKAPEFLQPKRHFANTQAAAKAFDEQRIKTIAYVKSTQDDLRNHFVVHPLLGTIDAYQVIFMTAAHGKRHTLQIEEVKKHPSFPK